MYCNNEFGMNGDKHSRLHTSNTGLLLLTHMLTGPDLWQVQEVQKLSEM